MNFDASRPRHGKRLRWARKIVRDWETCQDIHVLVKERARYERATAMLLAEALRAR